MHSSGSILKTYCEKVRHYLDDPDLDAKYDDNYLVRFFLPSAMTDVISRVSQMSDAQILSSFDIAVTPGTTHYKLPPAVAQVVRIGTVEAVTGLFIEDLRPRNQFNVSGPNWSIQGNSIVFQPAVEVAKTFTLVFVPSGDVMCHYVSTAAGSLNSNGTFTFHTTPSLGSIDKRPNAYQGAYIRIFGSSITDEILISDHDVTLQVATLGVAAHNATGLYGYEVVPFLMEPMIDAISISAAMRAGVGRKINQAHMQSLMLAYKQAIKTAHDTLANMNGRTGKYFYGPTIDSVPPFYVGPAAATGMMGAGAGVGGTAGCDCNDVASQTVQNQILLTVDLIQNDVSTLTTGGIDGGTVNAGGWQ
jgi:hypothetical protein